MSASGSRPEQNPSHRWFAAVYDLVAKVEGKQIEELRRYVASAAHGHVLEIGCGTGLNLDFYDWSKVERLEAIEPDPFMLKRTRKRLAAFPDDIRGRVTTHEAMAESLPFSDATFDSVVSMLVLCSVTEPHRAIAEIRRVLKSDGELRLAEHVRADGALASFQSAIQPIYGWFSGACQLGRDTEASLRGARLRLEVDSRFKLHPLAPAFRGVASNQEQSVRSEERS